MESDSSELQNLITDDIRKAHAMSIFDMFKQEILDRPLRLSDHRAGTMIYRPPSPPSNRVTVHVDTVFNGQIVILGDIKRVVPAGADLGAEIVAVIAEAALQQ